MEGEMLKENGYSRPQCIETPDGLIIAERDIQRSTPPRDFGSLSNHQALKHVGAHQH